MAGYIDTWGITLKTEAGTVQSTSYTVPGDFREGIDDNVGPSVTNAEFDATITVAAIQSMALWSDHDVTLKTNSSVAPGNTITLKANVMVPWDINHKEACPLTTTVTKFFITNADTVNTAHIKFTFLVDGTP